MDPETIRAKLLEAFPDATVTVVDLLGTRDHFRAEIISEVFRGQSLLEQHRLVYAALGSAMDGAIHALSLRTSAPK